MTTYSYSVRKLNVVNIRNQIYLQYERNWMKKQTWKITFLELKMLQKFMNF